MKYSLRSSRQEKRKKSGNLLVTLYVVVILLWILFAIEIVDFAKEQNTIMQDGQNTNQNMNSDLGGNEENREEDKEFVWVVEGEPVSKDLLYGFYLPMNCSNTVIANVDVVTNMFEKKEWSTYLSSTGKELTLSALPLLWDGLEVNLSLISKENIQALDQKTGYKHEEEGIQSYKKMIREMIPEYSFVTLTYYDNRRNLYTVDCAYTVDGNDMKVFLVYFDEKCQEYSLIWMEDYQVLRKENEITIYKDKNFVTYVPYNLCTNASKFQIEAFAKYQNERYQDIVGITYYNFEPKADSRGTYGCVYFADGSVASKATFDFSTKNQMTIRWEEKEMDYYGTSVVIEGSGEVTFSYKMVRDTGLILGKDSIEYRYLEKMDE